MQHTVVYISVYKFITVYLYIFLPVNKLFNLHNSIYLLFCTILCLIFTFTCVFFCSYISYEIVEEIGSYYFTAIVHMTNKEPAPFTDDTDDLQCVYRSLGFKSSRNSLVWKSWLHKMCLQIKFTLFNELQLLKRPCSSSGQHMQQNLEKKKYAKWENRNQIQKRCKETVFRGHEKEMNMLVQPIKLTF